MLNFLKATVVAGVLGLGSAASAAVVTESFSVASTSTSSGAPESFSFDYALDASLSRVYNFDAPGIFSLFDDGTATMSGRVFNSLDMSSGFDFAIELDSTFLQAPVFKSVFGAVPHGNERYLDLEGGTVSGFGVLAGLDFTTTRFPGDGSAVFQFGGGVTADRGPNQYTSDFGFSFWLGVLDVTSSSCAVCGNSIIPNIKSEQFDIVGNLTPVSTVPLPAGVLLLLTGLGAVFGIGRRKTV